MLLLPLTIFLLIIICFRISATLAKLNAFVLFSQVIGQPLNIRRVLLAVEGWSEILARIMTTILNLDFFRDLIPLCLKMSHLKALVLQYVATFYPLVLTIVLYILIQWHANHPVGCLQRLFKRCFSCFGREWNVKTSVVEVFATFLVLLYMKLITVSFDLLVSSPVYDMTRKRVFVLRSNS